MTLTEMKWRELNIGGCFPGLRLALQYDDMATAEFQLWYYGGVSKLEL